MILILNNHKDDIHLVVGQDHDLLDFQVHPDYIKIFMKYWIWNWFIGCRNLIPKVQLIIIFIRVKQAELVIGSTRRSDQMLHITLFKKQGFVKSTRITIHNKYLVGHAKIWPESTEKNFSRYEKNWCPAQKNLVRFHKVRRKYRNLTRPRKKWQGHLKILPELVKI